MLIVQYVIVCFIANYLITFLRGEYTINENLFWRNLYFALRFSLSDTHTIQETLLHTNKHNKTAHTNKENKQLKCQHKKTYNTYINEGKGVCTHIKEKTFFLAVVVVGN